MIIEGAISVKAALSNHKREVKKIFIDQNKKTKDFNYIRSLAKNNNVEVLEMKSEYLSNMAVGKTFGGVLAEAGQRNSDELGDGDVFYLDGIEDPFNMGYIMRNLYAFGIKNLILAKRDYSNMEYQLLKSSAGAYDMMNIKFSEDVLVDVKELKKKNYHVYALMRSDKALDIFETKFKEKALFMIGGEKRGIASQLLDEADNDLFIPYGSDFRNALNASNAASVVATLLFNQRKK